MKLILTTLSILFAIPSMACVCRYPDKLDNLSQLDKYAFVALVHITDDGDTAKGQSTTLKFEIKERFKGDNVSEVIENLVNSSCDMGISKGEDWLLYGLLINGKLVVQPCDRNIRYRRANGERDWLFKRGVEDLQILQRLYAKTGVKHKDGLETVFYKNGKRNWHPQKNRRIRCRWKAHLAHPANKIIPHT